MNFFCHACIKKFDSELELAGHYFIHHKMSVNITCDLCKVPGFDEKTIFSHYNSAHDLVCYSLYEEIAKSLETGVKRFPHFSLKKVAIRMCDVCEIGMVGTEFVLHFRVYHYKLPFSIDHLKPLPEAPKVESQPSTTQTSSSSDSDTQSNSTSEKSSPAEQPTTSNPTSDAEVPESQSPDPENEPSLPEQKPVESAIKPKSKPEVENQTQQPNALLAQKNRLPSDTDSGFSQSPLELGQKTDKFKFGKLNANRKASEVKPSKPKLPAVASLALSQPLAIIIPKEPLPPHSGLSTDLLTLANGPTPSPRASSSDRVSVSSRFSINSSIDSKTPDLNVIEEIDQVFEDLLPPLRTPIVRKTYVDDISPPVEIKMSVYICMACDLQSVDKDEAEKHIVAKHPEKAKYSCDECGDISDSHLMFNDHLASHNTPALDGLEVGKMMVTFEYCYECNTYMGEWDLEAHFQREHSDFLGFRCPECFLLFRFPSALLLHYDETHDMSMAMPNRYGVYLNQTAMENLRMDLNLAEAYRYFGPKLKKLVKKFTEGSKTMWCEMCREEFVCLMALLSHYDTEHDNTNAIVYRCSSCRQQFPRYVLHGCGCYALIRHRVQNQNLMSERLPTSACVIDGCDKLMVDHFDLHLINNHPHVIGLNCPFCCFTSNVTDTFYQHVLSHDDMNRMKLQWRDSPWSAF